MTQTLLRVTVQSLALLFIPLGVAAQGEGIDPSQLPAEARPLVAEIEQVQTQLHFLQQEALQDPEIQAVQEAFGARVRQAMTEIDPATPDLLDRLQSLLAEAQTAVTEQDEARMGELVAEARQIEQKLGSARAAAAERPEIAARAAVLRARVEEKMVELDPQAEELVERFESLQAELASVLRQNGR